MWAIGELCLKYGIATVVIIIFIWLFIKINKRQEESYKKANDDITKINQEIFNLFVNETKTTNANTQENLKLNKEITRQIKNVNVIQAQTMKVLREHNNNSMEAWGKLLHGFDKVCERLNGSNPEMLKLRKEMKEFNKKLEKISRNQVES